MKITQTDNPVAELVRNGKNKRVTGLALELANFLNASVAKAKENEFPKSRTDKIYQKGRDEIGKRLFEAVDSRAKAIRDEFSKAENSYAENEQRHINRRSLELGLAQNRFGAMSDTELRTELENISTAEFTGDPVTIDALFSAVKSSGIPPTDVAPHRELLLERDYKSPWKQNPEGRELQSELKMCEKCQAFDFPVVFDGEGVTLFSVDDLLDGVE